MYCEPSSWLGSRPAETFADGSKATTYGLTNRLEPLPTRSAFGSDNGEDLRSVMFDGEITLALPSFAVHVRSDPSPVHIRRRRILLPFGRTEVHRSSQGVLPDEPHCTARTCANAVKSQLRVDLAMPLAQEGRFRQHARM